MKHYKLILQGLLLLCLVGCKNETTESAVPPQMMLSSNAIPHEPVAIRRDAIAPESVFVCNSSGAARYHYNENCSGLNRCKHTIEKTTIKKAEAIGLTLCKLEY